MKCLICGDEFSDGDTSVAGVCMPDILQLISSAVKAKNRETVEEMSADDVVYDEYISTLGHTTAE